MGLLVGGQGCWSRSRPVMEEADPGSCLPELGPDEPPRPCGWPASVRGLDGEQPLLHEQRPANLGERDVTRQKLR